MDKKSHTEGTREDKQVLDAVVEAVPIVSWLPSNPGQHNGCLWCLLEDFGLPQLLNFVSKVLNFALPTLIHLVA